MRNAVLLIAALSTTALAGCLNNDTQRALAGGLAGAVIADTTGGNATTGAIAGAAAGALCDDAGVCN